MTWEKPNALIALLPPHLKKKERQESNYTGKENRDERLLQGEGAWVMNKLGTFCRGEGEL